MSQQQAVAGVDGPAMAQDEAQSWFAHGNLEAKLQAQVLAQLYITVSRQEILGQQIVTDRDSFANPLAQAARKKRRFLSRTDNF